MSFLSEAFLKPTTPASRQPPPYYNGPLGNGQYRWPDAPLYAPHPHGVGYQPHHAHPQPNSRLPFSTPYSPIQPYSHQSSFVPYHHEFYAPQPSSPISPHPPSPGAQSGRSRFSTSSLPTPITPSTPPFLPPQRQSDVCGLVTPPPSEEEARASRLLNLDSSAQELRDAFKGIGTSETTLVRVLADKDASEIAVLREAYTRLFARDLERDIRKKTSGLFRDGLLAIVRGPLMQDVYLAHEAIDGLGTNKKLLNHALLSRTNSELVALKEAYVKSYGRRLVDDVRNDLSMNTERHFRIVLDAQRADNDEPVDPHKIDNDVRDLYNATEGRIGKDGKMVCDILSLRNDSQIRAISHEYEKKHGRSLEETVRRSFNGHMRDALLYQLDHAVDQSLHDAQLIEDAMAGLGTRDQHLINRIVRCHWNRDHMARVMSAYNRRYKKNLADRIRGETRGDYRKLLIACLGAS